MVVMKIGITMVMVRDGDGYGGGTGYIAKHKVSEALPSLFVH